MWLSTLKKVLALDIHHISCYNLTIEERTALWHFVNKKKSIIPNEVDQEFQFYSAHEILTNEGFNHYEISNYAKDKKYSKHNSNYWNRTSYLGLGPSAHSFHGNKRRWNIANNTKYMNAIDSGDSFFEEEVLSDKDVFNELLMLGLRTKQGVSKSVLSNFDYSKSSDFNSSLDEYITKNIIRVEGEFYYLDPKHYYLSDHYSSNLFID